MMPITAPAVSAPTILPQPPSIKEQLRRIRDLPPTRIAAVFFQSAPKEEPEARRWWWFDQLEQARRDFDIWVPKPLSNLERRRYFIAGDLLTTKRAALSGSFQTRADEEFYKGWSFLFEEIATSSYRSEEAEKKGTIAPHRTIDRLFDSLNVLGWINHPTSLLYTTLRSSLLSVLHREVQETIKGDFETQFFDTIVTLTTTQLLPLRLDQTTLYDIAATSFLHARNATELFDIITQYPDTTVAVDELARVLADDAERQAQLARHCRAQLVRRLCHTGAETTAILDVYMNTIQVVRRLDPSDVLLRAVAEPVRAYLRGRQDTVRCILQSLTDHSLSLYRELRRGEPIDAALLETNDEPTMHWQPEPSLNKPVGAFLQGTKGGKDADILAMLVSIYGSKELFVNEYRLMLADKLLSSDYDTDQERHTLELLKLRFGESSMNSASVMIKDIDDSVRTHKIIREQIADTAVDPVILSHIFWPTLQNDPIKLHPRMQALLDEYAWEYAKQKNPRQLRWIHRLGSITADVTVYGKKKEVTCTPLQLTLLSHFEDVECVTLAALSNETGIAENVLEKRMAFWISQNVVVLDESDPNYRFYRVAKASDSVAQQRRPPVSYTEDSQTAVSASAAAEQCDDILASYVKVMLANLEAASWQKIHNMLQTTVQDDQIQYNKTIPQLQSFLQQLVRQEQLECGPDGLFRLVKRQQQFTNSNQR